MVEQTTIILQGKDARMWTFMKALEAVGAFDVEYGKVVIDFGPKGRVDNIKIERSYKLNDFSTVDK